MAEGIIQNGYVRKEGDERDASHLTLDLVLPDDFDDATREAIHELVEERRVIRHEVVKAQGRNINLYPWVEGNTVRLMDIPTTTGALREISIARLGKGAFVDTNSDDFKEVQDDEIGQFERFLRGFIVNDPHGSSLRRRVNVMRWSNSPLGRLS